jgi:phosphoribosylformylglycinamidine synthase
MKNDYQIGATKISIPPTVLFSVIGKIDDVRLATTMDAKQAGDLVYLLGVTANELGASELYAQLGELGANLPQVDAATALVRYRTLNIAQSAGLIASCHDLSDGGLAVALAETAFSGGLGLAINLEQVETSGALTPAQILFSESASRLLVTVHPENQGRFASLFARQSCALLGTVTASGQLQIHGKGQAPLIVAGLDELKAAWQAPLREM